MSFGKDRGRGLGGANVRWNGVLLSVAFHPVEAARDDFLPPGIASGARRLVGARLPALVLGPVVAYLVGALPESHGQPGRVGRTQRRGLGDAGADYGHAQYIGLELQQQFVAHHVASE